MSDLTSPPPSLLTWLQASTFPFFTSFYFFAQQSCQTVFLNCLYLLLLCIGLQYSLARKTDSRLEDFNQYYCQGGISQQRLSAEYKFYHQLKWEQLSLVDQKNNVSICQPHLQSHYSDPPWNGVTTSASVIAMLWSPTNAQLSNGKGGWEGCWAKVFLPKVWPGGGGECGTVWSIHCQEGERREGGQSIAKNICFTYI